MPDEIPVPPPADPIPQVVPPDDPNRTRSHRIPDIDPPPFRPPVDEPDVEPGGKRLM